ncbi:response regulator [Candidatus Hydrogenedentota bacterium]
MNDGDTMSVLSTSDVAKFCHCSSDTVKRWIENGKLKAFRVSDSGHWRILPERLQDFMSEHGIPGEIPGVKEEGAVDGVEDLSGNRVLLVDDDESLITVLEEALKRDGRFNIDKAGSGFQAGIKVSQFKPNLIVLDLLLGDVDGREVCTHVKADDANKETKILGISGYVDLDDKGELEQAGFDDFMHKPFSMSAFVHRVCSLMNLPTREVNTSPA